MSYPISAPPVARTPPPGPSTLPPWRRRPPAGHSRRLAEPGRSPQCRPGTATCSPSTRTWSSATPSPPIRRPTVATNQSATVGLTAHQARALIAAADTDPHRGALRTRAAIRLLLEVGLRVAEVCGLDVADYGHNRGHRTLRYTAKGQRTMTRAIHPDTVTALDAYLAHRATTAGIAVGQLSGPLLVTASSARLDQPALFRLVRRLARAAHLPAWRQISPHSLRHSFATIYLDHGGNLRDLQDALGHASPTTTRRYDRDRHNLNRDATYTVGAALAQPSPADA